MKFSAPPWFQRHEFHSKKVWNLEFTEITMLYLQECISQKRRSSMWSRWESPVDSFLPHYIRRAAVGTFLELMREYFWHRYVLGFLHMKFKQSKKTIWSGYSIYNIDWRLKTIECFMHINYDIVWKLVRIEAPVNCGEGRVPCSDVSGWTSCLITLGTVDHSEL